MADMDQNSVWRRAATALRASVGPAFRTTRFLVAVMVLVSFGMVLLEAAGLLRYSAMFFDPVMAFFGLPGESSLVFLSSLFLNNYSAIAVMGTLDLSFRSVTILSVMCLIAHNLPVECAVMKKTGSSVAKMIFLRITVAFAAALLLNLVLPTDAWSTRTASLSVGGTVPAVGLSWGTLVPLIGDWALDSGALILKVIVLVGILMLVQKIMEEFGLIEALGNYMRPLMLLFGLPKSVGFLWIVSNVVGLAYGSAIMIERSEKGSLSPSDGDLFNHHAGISHSLLEDTILYVAIGVPAFWLVVPRVALAIIVVWLERLRRVLFRRSFRVGTA